MTALAVLDLDHLRPEAREHALENDEARIRRIRADRFVPYARAVEGLRLLEELLAYPERTCMPNVLIRAAEQFNRAPTSGAIGEPFTGSNSATGFPSPGTGKRPREGSFTRSRGL